MNEGEIDGSCSMHAEDEKRIQIFGRTTLCDETTRKT